MKKESSKKKKSHYRPQRKQNIFSIDSKKPYKLSRSRIEIFMRCPRCFYLDRKCGTEQPPMYAYTLNIAVDALLKKEFDKYREEGKCHPYLIANGIDAIPFSHRKLNNWRMNQRGIKHYHKQTNFIVHGAVDDVWINPQGELIIVDYKATSTKSEITLEDRESYKRQMEIYQWLFRKNGFKVSNTGYFFFCNGDSQGEGFTGVLPFKISILAYEGNDGWIEDVLLDIKKCLTANILPNLSETCDYCGYWKAVNTHIENYKTLQNNAYRQENINNIQVLS